MHQHFAIFDINKLDIATVHHEHGTDFLKNLLDACLGAIIWFGVGYAVAYDGMNPFIGVADASGFPSFALYQGHGATEDKHGGTFAGWWFQYVFAAAAATIVSGAVAERIKLQSFLLFVHLPLPWAGPGFALPVLYMIGIWVSLVLGLAFLCIYSWRVAEEARRRLGPVGAAARTSCEEAGAARRARRASTPRRRTWLAAPRPRPRSWSLLVPLPSRGPWLLPKQ